jgi:hypothetical protein
MSTYSESEAFRAGFLRRTAELHAMEKQASFSSAIVPVARATWNGAKQMKNVTPVMKNVTPVVQPPALMSGAKPGLMSQAGSWMKNSPKAVAGVAGTVGAVGAGAGVGAYANHQKNQLIDNVKSEIPKVLSAFQGDQGWNGPFGKLMAMLSFLFGGQNFINRKTQDFQQFASNWSGFHPSIRNAVKPTPAAPAAPAPTA